MTIRAQTDPESCPLGCGFATEDPYGGPCGRCWDQTFGAGDNLDCTHCGGEGLCWDGADPLGDCPDDPHACHACYGSGRRKDQWMF